jgi:hypothetical protein
LKFLKLLLHGRSLIVIFRDGEDEADQEISSLAELSLEFAIVLIKVVNPPDIILIQKALLATLVIVLAILSNHGDVEIELLRSDKKEDLVDPTLDLSLMVVESILLRPFLNELVEYKLNLHLQVLLKT